MDAYRLLLSAAVLCMCAGVCLSSTSDSFYVVRKDYRKCSSPLCGGYFVQKLNGKGETYVFNLRVNHLGRNVLQPYNKFLDTVPFPGPWSSIVYAGYLVKNTRFPTFQDLYVTRIYLGYPGVNVTPGPYYNVSQSGRTIRATLLNTKTTVSITNGKVTTFAPVAIVDQGVQRKQILSKGALVIATIKPPAVLVRQVFFRIPVVAGPCPVFKIACNSPPDVLGYIRTEDLCFTPKCIKPKDIRFCPLFIPTCPVGYKLSGWTGPTSCSAYACDPIFFPNATKFQYS